MGAHKHTVESVQQVARVFVNKQWRETRICDLATARGMHAWWIAHSPAGAVVTLDTVSLW